MTRKPDGEMLVTVRVLDSKICEDCEELEIEEIFLPNGAGRWWGCANANRCRAVYRRIQEEEAKQP